MGKTDRFWVPRDCRFLLVPSQNVSLEPLRDWNLSTIENYKFDLRSFHRAELRPLTEAIKHPPICKHLTTIIYFLHTTVFTILCGQRLPSSTLNYPTTVNNKQLFTSSQLHAWITKTSAQKAASHRNQTGSFRVLTIHSPPFHAKQLGHTLMQPRIHYRVAA